MPAVDRTVGAAMRSVYKALLAAMVGLYRPLGNSMRSKLHATPLIRVVWDGIFLLVGMGALMDDLSSAFQSWISAFVMGSPGPDAFGPRALC